MPGLTRNQKIAKQKRLLTTDNRFRKVDDSFVSQGNAVDERYLNEYIQSLFGMTIGVVRIYERARRFKQEI